MNQVRSISKKKASVIYLENYAIAKNSRLQKNGDMMSRSLLLSFVEETSISAATGHDFVLHSSNLQLDLKQLSPGLLAAIWLLCAEEVSEEELNNLVQKTERNNASLAQLSSYLQKFIELGSICHTVCADGDSLATLVPIATPYPFHFSLAAPDKKYCLSHLTCCDRENGLLTLKSSLFPGKVMIKDWRSEATIGELKKPQNSHSLSELTGISVDRVQLFLSLLLSAKMLSELNEELT